MTIDEQTAPAALLERRGAVALITLNRPQAMNAVNAALSTAAGSALDELASDPSLRVGVITGAGRTFCAGADLKELAAGRTAPAARLSSWRPHPGLRTPRARGATAGRLPDRAGRP